MIFKKKEFFLLISIILLQSCSGGRIGNFLESSFNDIEQISQDEISQKTLEPKKVVLQDDKRINNKNNEKLKKLEKPKSLLEPKKVDLQENKEINNKNLEKIQKQKNSKIKSSSKEKKIGLQSYKIIFILKDVDPKDPTQEFNNILSNSEVNFEIEKIERIFDSENKNININ